VNQKNHPVPPLYFSRLTVLNEEVDYDAEREDNILDKHITEASRIDLPNQRNTFSLEFAVLEYTNPRKIRYAYRLDRFDTDWNYTTPLARVATYTNLPAGTPCRSRPSSTGTKRTIPPSPSTCASGIPGI
jgi:hypothetical protein